MKKYQFVNPRVNKKHDKTEMILSKNLRCAIVDREKMYQNNIFVHGKKRGIVTFLKSNLLQEQESFIITDYRGRIFSDIGRALIEDNYDVKLIDLHNMSPYDSFNPFYYIRNCLIETYRHKMIDAVVKEIVRSEKIFVEEKTNFLKALIYYFYETKDCHFNYVDLVDFMMEAADDEILFDPYFEKTVRGDKALSHYYDYRRLDIHTRRSVIMDLVMLLNIYGAEFVKTFTSTDTLELGALPQGKHAVFLVTGDSSFPFTEMIISCIYQIAHILHEEDVELRNKIEIDPTMELPVRYIMDAGRDFVDFDELVYTVKQCESCTYYTDRAVEDGLEKERFENADIQILMSSEHLHTFLEMADLEPVDANKKDPYIVVMDDQAYLDAGYDIRKHPLYLRTQNGIDSLKPKRDYPPLTVVRNNKED